MQVTPEVQLDGAGLDSALSEFREFISRPSERLRSAARAAIRWESRLDPDEIAPEMIEHLLRRFVQVAHEFVSGIESAMSFLPLPNRGGTMLTLDAALFDFIRNDLGYSGPVLDADEKAARDLWTHFAARPSVLSADRLLGRWRPLAAESPHPVEALLLRAVWRLISTSRSAAIASGGPTVAPPNEQPTTGNSLPQPAGSNGDAEAIEATEVGAEKARGGSQDVPALTAGVLDVIRAALWNPDRHLRPATSSEAHEVLDALGRCVGRVRATVDVPVGEVRRLLSITERLAAHRVLRWVIERATAQFVADPNGRYADIDVEGGMAGLVRSLGMRGGKAETTVRDTLRALAAIEMKMPDDQWHTLFDVHLRRRSSSAGSGLVLTVNSPLLPGFPFAQKRGGRIAQLGRRLVPVPPELPPLVGHEVHHGSLAALQWGVIQIFRERAEQLSTEGFVTIDDRIWKRLFSEAHVRVDPEIVFNAWIAAELGDPERFLLLADADKPGYALADTYERVQTLILYGAAKQMRGRAIQQRGMGARTRARSIRN